MFKDALRRYTKYQVGWRGQAIDKHKKKTIESKWDEGMSDEEIAVYMTSMLEKF